MPDIKLPDGKKIPFSKTIDGFEIAKKISKSLAKDACIMSVNGKLRDLSFSIDKDVQIKIITTKDKEGLETIRHDTAHILAMAVQELFSETQVTIGPVIEDGFYYDFSSKESFTDENLTQIENKMNAEKSVFVGIYCDGELMISFIKRLTCCHQVMITKLITQRIHLNT